VSRQIGVEGGGSRTLRRRQLQHPSVLRRECAPFKVAVPSASVFMITDEQWAKLRRVVEVAREVWG
jgi:hypothetical protein